MSEFVMVKRELLNTAVNGHRREHSEAMRELRAVLAQEAGKCEPVAVVAEESHQSLGFMVMDVEGSKYHPPVTSMLKKAILLDDSIPSGTKLYTSSPAPVSVLLPECKPEPLHPHNDGLDEYRQPVHVGELDPAQRLALARGELK